MNKLQRIKSQIKDKSFIGVIPTKSVNKVLDRNFVNGNHYKRKMYLLGILNGKPFAISQRRYKKLGSILRECGIDLYIDEINLYDVQEAKKKSDFIL